MKSKFLVLAGAALMALSLSSCGNMGMGAGNYSFDKVHILDGGATQGHCEKITKWYNDDMGVEIKLESGGSLYLSEGTYILVSGRCPICGAD